MTKFDEIDGKFSIFCDVFERAATVSKNSKSYRPECSEADGMNLYLTSSPEASLKLALDLAIRHGFAVLPCGATLKGEKKGMLKRPLDTDWTQRASANPAEIKRMWANRYCQIAVGIACGKSGIWVLDVDLMQVEKVKDPDTGKMVETGNVFYGLQELEALKAQYGDLPKTFTVRTASGGMHYYFKQPSEGPELTNSTGRLPKGIDVRGRGGQVIAPGNVYEWNGTIQRYELADASPIAEAPEWLLALIRDRAPVQAIYPEPAPAQPAPAQAPQAARYDGPYQDEHGRLIIPGLAEAEPYVDYSDPVARKILKEVRQDAVRYINEHPEGFLKRDNSGKGFVCPLCGSGSHSANGDGLTENPKKRNGDPYETPHFTCWACKEIVSASTLDIIGKVYSIPAKGAFPALIKKGCELYGIKVQTEVDHRITQAEQALNQYQAGQVTATAAATAQPAPAQSATAYTLDNGKTIVQKKSEPSPEPEIDYTEYFRQCVERLNQTRYDRGISQETLKLYNVGYDPEWKHPKVPAGVPATPRLIIPTSKHSYIARDTRPVEQIPPEQQRYVKQKVGSTDHFFNFEVLDKLIIDTAFITEGEFDALSLLQSGIPAIALGSVGNAGKLLTALDKRLAAGQHVPPLVLALDNDEAGHRAQALLRTGLLGRSLPFVEMEIPNGKDPNEAFIKDKDALFKACFDAVNRATEEAEALKERMKEQLRSQCAGRALDAFLSETRNKEAEYYPTGVKGLDYWLDGGLYAGLYIIGAISSLGKTTFALSIADNIAAKGQDVLIFSLEMARNELIAKSVSRITGRISLSGKDFPASTAYAQTTRSVMGKRTALYSEEEKTVLDMAFDEYRQIGEHLFISEGIGNIGVEQVRAQVQNHTRIMGKPPVVLIDYLQILAPYDPKSTDKQNTDKAVLELKRISRDFATPVFVISSFNRDNYSQSVSMVAFKESGAIEYSSDVLIGMQYNGMDNPKRFLKKMHKKVSVHKDENVRLLVKMWQKQASEGKEQEIQIKVLKNRNGRRGDCVLKFWPRFNYFEDLPEAEVERRRREEEAESEDNGE